MAACIPGGANHVPQGEAGALCGDPRLAQMPILPSRWRHLDSVLSRGPVARLGGLPGGCAHLILSCSFMSHALLPISRPFSCASLPPVLIFDGN